MDFKEMKFGDVREVIASRFPEAMVWADLPEDAALKMKWWFACWFPSSYGCPCPQMHVLVYFPNNCGASIIRHDFSYGASDCLFEVGVVHFTGKDEDSWELNYDTPITDDVLGYQSLEEVLATLKKIEGLKNDW